MSASRPGEPTCCTTTASSSGALASSWIASTARSFSCRKRASISGVISSLVSMYCTRATRNGQPSRNSSTRKRLVPCTTR